LRVMIFQQALERAAELPARIVLHVQCVQAEKGSLPLRGYQRRIPILAVAFFGMKADQWIVSSQYRCNASPRSSEINAQSHGALFSGPFPSVDVHGFWNMDP